VDFFKRLKTGHEEWKAKASSLHLSKPQIPDPERLDTAENVAAFTWWLLTKTTDAEFVSQDWDIREEKRWIEEMNSAS